MRASIFVLTGALLAFSCAGAEAQDAARPGVPVWTPVDNCQTANALGPQVYADVAGNAPNAVGELQLLVSALKMCNAASGAQDAQAPQGPPPDAQAQPQNGMVLDDGPDASPNEAPPPNQPQYSVAPDDSADAAPPGDDSGASSDSGRSGLVDGIMQALEMAEQLFTQYANPTAGGSVFPAPGGYGPGSYGAVPGYGQSYGRYGSSYERSTLPPYARSTYGPSTYGGRGYGQPSYGQSSYGQSSYGRSSYGQPSYAQPARRNGAEAYRRPASSFQRLPSYAARGAGAIARRSYERISRAGSVLRASRAAASALSHFLR